MAIDVNGSWLCGECQHCGDVHLHRTSADHRLSDFCFRCARNAVIWFWLRVLNAKTSSGNDPAVEQGETTWQPKK